MSAVDHQREFAVFVDLLLRLHERRQKELPPIIALSMHPFDFILQFCTVRINLGRGLGKTTYIANTAKRGDVVITADPLGMEQKVNRGVHVIMKEDEFPPRLAGLEVDAIWVDDAQGFDLERAARLAMNKKARRIVAF